MKHYRHLLNQISIRGRTIRNRVISTAHAPGYAEDGLPGERYQTYHEAKARGGIGLTMFGGSSNVARDSGSIYGQIYVGDDRVIPVFQGFSERIHQHGATLMCQITHMGRRTSWDTGDWLPTKAPSAIRDPAHHSSPYALSQREIARIIEDFAAAARRCREGGLDGIEVLASSHLLGQFISPLTNLRDDVYGGSLENRARFFLQVLEACREVLGDGLILSARFNASEENEGGLSSGEGIELAAMLGEQGAADILNVNGAYGGTDMGVAEYMPGMAFSSAPYVELARRVKEASGLITIQAAHLSEAATANWAIEKGYVDMAGLTRAHIADPRIVSKIMAGQEERIRPCVGAGYCLDRIYGGREALCVHNVTTGRENWLPSEIPTTDTPKRAVVVGGGPAGMEAARVLALRGHQVTLFEAASKLGGQINLAARAGWRKNMIGIADWLAQEIEHLGVDTRTNAYVDHEDGEIMRLKPDIVIISTGGIPDIDLPEGGSELALSTWDVLSGHATPSGEVLVCDATGGHGGLSVADMLATGGAQVSFATPDRMAGRGIGGQNYPVYLRNLRKAGVVIHTDLALMGLRREGNRLIASLRHSFGRDLSEIAVDTVIVDHGTTAMSDLFDAFIPLSTNFGELDHEAFAGLKPQPGSANPEGVFQLFRIGDALAARDIHAAIFEANRLARVL